MNEKNQKFQKAIDSLKITMKHYELRLAAAIGKDVYVISGAGGWSLKNVKGKTQVCMPVEASLFTKSVAEEILTKAKFNNLQGQYIRSEGLILAETFFTEMRDDAKSTIEILEQAIKTLEEAGK
jgi:hypothetical protein